MSLGEGWEHPSSEALKAAGRITAYGEGHRDFPEAKECRSLRSISPGEDVIRFAWKHRHENNSKGDKMLQE